MFLDCRGRNYDKNTKYGNKYSEERFWYFILKVRNVFDFNTDKNEIHVEPKLINFSIFVLE